MAVDVIQDLLRHDENPVHLWALWVSTDNWPAQHRRKSPNTTFFEPQLVDDEQLSDDDHICWDITTPSISEPNRWQDCTLDALKRFVRRLPEIWDKYKLGHQLVSRSPAVPCVAPVALLDALLSSATLVFDEDAVAALCSMPPRLEWIDHAQKSRFAAAVLEALDTTVFPCRDSPCDVVHRIRLLYLAEQAADHFTCKCDSDTPARPRKVKCLRCVLCTAGSHPRDTLRLLARHTIRSLLTDSPRQSGCTSNPTALHQIVMFLHLSDTALPTYITVQQLFQIEWVAVETTMRACRDHATCWMPPLNALRIIAAYLNSYVKQAVATEAGRCPADSVALWDDVSLLVQLSEAVLVDFSKAQARRGLENLNPSRCLSAFPYHVLASYLKETADAAQALSASRVEEAVNTNNGPASLSLPSVAVVSALLLDHVVAQVTHDISNSVPRFLLAVSDAQGAMRVLRECSRFPRSDCVASLMLNVKASLVSVSQEVLSKVGLDVLRDLVYLRADEPPGQKPVNSGGVSLQRPAVLCASHLEQAVNLFSAAPALVKWLCANFSSLALLEALLVLNCFARMPKTAWLSAVGGPSHARDFVRAAVVYLVVHSAPDAGDGVVLTSPSMITAYSFFGDVSEFRGDTHLSAAKPVRHHMSSADMFRYFMTTVETKEGVSCLEAIVSIMLTVEQTREVVQTPEWVALLRRRQA